MSLRAFHILFIVLATAMAFLVGSWGLMHADYLPVGIGSTLLGAVLVLYGIWFGKKLRNKKI